MPASMKAVQSDVQPYFLSPSMTAVYSVNESAIIQVGAGQNRYRRWLLSGRFWQGFAILFPEQPKLAVFQQRANV
jgi:hypothetical protein